MYLISSKILPEEADDKREQIMAEYQASRYTTNNIVTPITLHEGIAHHARLIVFGEPGSGKTTLLT